MKLKRIIIKNFRRIEFADVHLNSASFLIGPNNCGKTSIIKAIEALLSLSDIIKADDFRVLPDGTRADNIEICGYFSDIDNETANSRGFKGRVINGEYIYKKTYTLSNIKPVISTMQYSYNIAEEFSNINTWQQLIDKGYSKDELETLLESKPNRGNLNSKLPEGWEFKIEGAINWDFESEPKEIINPGGIPANVNSKLPELVHIPSYANSDDVGKADGTKTIIGKCLDILFKDLLKQSDLVNGIQEQLACLQDEMSPKKEGSITDILCSEVNKIIEDVFPGCGISINPLLQDLCNVIKPMYDVKMFSNVDTDASRQGTGLVRTTIFSMLRYHSQLKQQSDSRNQPLIVAFEEPEIYLHPSAANLLRDTIYLIGQAEQIICTTHSPWMIDLSKDWQSLTKVYLNENKYSSVINYGLSEASNKLVGDEKEQLKLIKLFDDELSRVFFTDRCIIVEGDSELVAIKNSFKHLDHETVKGILSRTQIVRARGKATIIPLVKYLKALNIPIYVIHDKDSKTQGAEKFNKSILEELGDEKLVSQLEDCLEDCLGYEAPKSEKPYRAFVETSKWNSWNDIPEKWRSVLESAFNFNSEKN